MARRRGDETPDWMGDKQRRLAKIRRPEGALEAEAAAAAAAKAETERAAQDKRKAENGKRPGPASRAAFKRARGQGATQLHRSRQPRAVDQGRLHPGLQRAGRGGRRAADHCRPRADAEHERSVRSSFPWSTAFAATSAASPRRFRRTPAIAAKTISRLSRPAASRPTSPSAAPSSQPPSTARSAAH